MSKIEKELSEVTEVSPKRGEDRSAFLDRIVVAVSKLSDKDWDGLSKDAQDWFNDAADAKNAKKEVPDFPDLKEAVKEEKTTTRRRAAAEDEDEAKGTGTVEVKAKDLKEGMALKITTKRGKEASGHVVEVTDEIVAIKQGDGEEVEFAFDRIEKMETLAEAKSTGRRKGGDEDETDADPIKVGATVTVTTKRGKEVTGKIVEIDEEVVVLDVDGADEEFDRSRVETIKIAGKTGKSSKDEDEKPASRRGAKDDGEKPKDDGEKKRSSNNGVSIGVRIKELIADNLDASEEQIAKILKKEGLEFRDNTLKLNYVDAHKFIDILKARKLLK